MQLLKDQNERLQKEIAASNEGLKARLDLDSSSQRKLVAFQKKYFDLQAICKNNQEQIEKLQEFCSQSQRKLSRLDIF